MAAMRSALADLAPGKHEAYHASHMGSSAKSLLALFGASACLQCASPPPCSSGWEPARHGAVSSWFLRDAGAVDAGGKAMGIASTATRRGQQDTIGYASTPEQMAKVFQLSGEAPRPERLGTPPAPGVAGAIAPHDDYLFAGRVYREVLPLVTAPTVVVVGVFHKYKRFGVRNVIVFDPYETWRAPDGDVAVSPLRQELIARMPGGTWVQDASMHDAEHSVEALVFWLRHARPDVSIVPLIVPASSFERLQELAGHAGRALSESMAGKGWKLGRDVAVLISADGIHYGKDFQHVPFGEGGVEAYQQATARDRALLTGPLAGQLNADMVRQLYETFVEPSQPDTYRVTWCGRFSIPFGLMMLSAAAGGSVTGHPIAYGTSVGWPELDLRSSGLGQTAPASLYHFVGHPAAVFTLVEPRP